MKIWKIFCLGAIFAIGQNAFANECKEETRVVSKKPVIKSVTECSPLGRGKVMKVVFTYTTSKKTGKRESFWPNGQKAAVLYLKNGVQEDSAIAWDSLGCMTYRGFYKNGLVYGLQETWYSEGRPKEFKTYNDSGNGDGHAQEWWENGNKRAEFIYKNGFVISGTEYFTDGTKRIQYQMKYEPGNKSVSKLKYIQGEAWAPNGKSTGKIEDGKGEWTMFSVPRKDGKSFVAFKEIVKDSLKIKIDKLDSAAVAAWIK